MGKTDPGFEHGGKVAIVLGLGPLEDHLELGGQQVLQGGDLQHTVLGPVRLADPTEVDAAKKGNFDRLVISSGHQQGQGVAPILKCCRPLHERKNGPQVLAFQRLFRKKIEIDGKPVSQAQGDGGSPIEHKPESGGSAEFGPDKPLCGRQDVHAGYEKTAHANALFGRGGTWSGSARPNR